MRTLALLALLIIALTGAMAQPAAKGTSSANAYQKTDQEWRKILTPAQYDVLRNKGTERAFTGAYWNNHEPGVYYCAGCHQKLFVSDTKYDSGCGWPSFYKAVSDSVITIKKDYSYGMIRDEVLCSRCGGHLGHVFDDGPNPTGLRYCMNSVSLSFEAYDPKKKPGQ